MTDALIDEVAAELAGRDDCPAVLVHADDGRRWRLGADGGATEVHGAAPAILAWLIGRDDGSSLHVASADRPMPTLPRWL